MKIFLNMMPSLVPVEILNFTKQICDIKHIYIITHMRFENFKIPAGTRLGMMFGNRFRLQNILARTNKPRLLLVFQNSMNMLSFDGIFCYDKHNIFL